MQRDFALARKWILSAFDCLHDKKQQQKQKQ